VLPLLLFQLLLLLLLLLCLLMLQLCWPMLSTRCHSSCCCCCCRSKESLVYAGEECCSLLQHPLLLRLVISLLKRAASPWVKQPSAGTEEVVSFHLPHRINSSHKNQPQKPLDASCSAHNT
jgi:hypothetical protein